MKKEYYCCICHEKIERNYRLVKQKYGLNRFGQFKNIDNYDFCNKCFSIFHGWIKKHKKEQ